MTTSMVNHWLNDLLSHDIGILRISSHSARASWSHYPDDLHTIQCNMVEAMDDSLLFATNLTTLCRATLCVEQFQANYGWMTNWSKSVMYIHNHEHLFPSQILVPTLDASDLSPSTTIPLAYVPVSHGPIEFLQVSINEPKTQFLHLQDLISNFKLPPSSIPIPFTVLQQLIMQRLISKIRPCLSFQTIAPKDVQALDWKIASIVHTQCHFPFHFSSCLLSTPLANLGFDFLSVEFLNAQLAATGVLRDLNHHLPICHHLAHITLADWSCSFNFCMSPFDSSPPLKDFQRHHHQLPWSWIVAQETLADNNFTLRLAFFMATSLSTTS